MKLEATPTPIALGNQQIQNQLEAMHLEIQIFHKDKGKEVCTEVWCIKCKATRKRKDQCPVLNNYLTTHGPS